MAKSASPTATASASKKRRSRGGTLTLDEVKKLGTELLSSRAHLNHAPALLALLSPTAPLDLALEALISLQSFFVPLIPSIPSASATATAGDAGSDPELVFGAWLRQRFDELVAALVELSVSPHSDDAIRDVALDALMDFVKLGKDGKFQSAIYHKFLYAVVHAADPIDTLLELLGSKYFKYTDVCYFTYTSLDKIANSLGSKTTASGKDASQNGSDGSENRSNIFVHNIYNLLAHVPSMDFQKESTFDMWSTVGLSSKGEKDSSKDTSTYIKKKLKLKFTKAWLSFLKLPLPLDVYKEVLASIHQNVIPSMSNPSILCDFLTRSYDIGGVISVMALSGLFILMTQHGLEYPKFYEKLYALLTPAVFMAKHRSVFLQLLDTCLKSSYLPAYLAAAFAKRLSRLALSVPPAGALIIIALIHNLLRRHPSVNFLVHWEVDESDSNATGEASQSKKIGADPFNNNEADPAKSGAMRNEIMHRRGLRQGDPLSPHLFILAIDVLNNIFDLATQEGYLTKLKGRHASLRISMYADDAVIFTNPNRQDIARIMEIMSAFGEATGLSINMAKSTVAPIRCTGLDMDDILHDFPGPRVSFPTQYLGLPLTLGRLKMVHLQYIQDRAKGKVAGWQGKLLNVAGRRELIRSVLSSLPVYLLTVIKAPKNFLKELDKLRRRFLWVGDTQLTGGKCKVAWTKVCTPTVNGGLAIIDLEKFSRALRLRWMWYSWETRARPWKGLELPLDSEDIALFNAATRVDLGNGDKALFWSLDLPMA